MFPEEARLVRHRADVIRPALDASGAWGGARRDAKADVSRALLRERVRAGDAGKSADRGRDGRGLGGQRRDGRRQWGLRVALAARAARALCRLDVGRFVERSCAVLERGAESRAWLQLAALPRLQREKLWLTPRERPAAQDEPAELLAQETQLTARARLRQELMKRLAREASAQRPVEE